MTNDILYSFRRCPYAIRVRWALLICWDKNIRISAICPSWVNTKMAQDISSLDKSRMTQPEDIAEICSTILKLPTQSVPFEIALNCNYEFNLN